MGTKHMVDSNGYILIFVGGTETKPTLIDPMMP